MLTCDDIQLTGGHVKRTRISRLAWSTIIAPTCLTTGLLGLLLAGGLSGCGSNSTPVGSGFRDGSLVDGGPDGDATTSLPSGDSSMLRSDSSGGKMEACAASTATASVLPLDMYILLDRSGSMADNGSWTQEVMALNNFIYDSHSNGLGVGLQYLPLPDLCSPSAYADPAVPIALLPNNQGALATSLSASRPFGGTPTVPALEGAIQLAKARQKSNPDRDIVIVLSTDGLPDTSTCAYAGDGGLPNDTDNAIALLQAAASSVPPIKTFVIGIGNQTSLFDTFATAGGTTPIYVGTGDAGTTADIETPLIAALAAIRSNALPCEYTIPQASSGAIDFGEVNVTFKPTPGSSAEQPFYGVSSPSACTTTSLDWYYDDPNNPKHIDLCPNACTAVKASTQGTVNVAYGCVATNAPPK